MIIAGDWAVPELLAGCTGTGAMGAAEPLRMVVFIRTRSLLADSELEPIATPAFSWTMDSLAELE
jgi:hypothetical protein